MQLRAACIIVALAGNSGPDGKMGYPGAYQPVIGAGPRDGSGSGGTVFLPSLRRPSQPSGMLDVPDASSSRRLHRRLLQLARAQVRISTCGPRHLGCGSLPGEPGSTQLLLPGRHLYGEPHVAGIAALMAQKRNSLTPADAEAILTGTAVPLPPGCRDVLNPNTGAEDEICWGADATGSGLATANAALAGT